MSKILGLAIFGAPIDWPPTGGSYLRRPDLEIDNVVIWRDRWMCYTHDLHKISWFVISARRSVQTHLRREHGVTLTTRRWKEAFD